MVIYGDESYGKKSNITLNKQKQLRWFGARWFGIPGVSPSNNSFHFRESQESKPTNAPKPPIYPYVWVFRKNRDTPKRMVKIMENPTKMDDLGVKPIIFGNVHMLNPIGLGKKTKTQTILTTESDRVSAGLANDAALHTCFFGKKTWQFPWGAPQTYMDVSENKGTPKSSILIRFSIINHPFWGTPIFENTHMFYSGGQFIKKDSIHKFDKDWISHW